MPANPGLSARTSPPAASASHPGTKTPSFLAVGYRVVDDDDDDDFQSPPSARPLKPSDGAASRRPRKKAKPSSSCRGKENRPVFGRAVPAERVAGVAAGAAGALAAGSRVSADVPQVKESAGGGICGILRSGSDGSNVSSGEKKELEPGAYSSVPDECAKVGRPEFDPSSLQKDGTGSRPREAHHYSRLIEPMFPEFNAKSEFGGVGFKEAEELGSGVHGSASGVANVDSTQPSVASRSEDKESKVSGFGVPNGKSHLTTVHSKLPVTNAKYDFGGGDRKVPEQPCLRICSLVSEQREAVDEDVGTLKVETREKESNGTDDCKGNHRSNSVEPMFQKSHMAHCFEADDCGNFEIGTQLNELINLCVEDYAEGHPNSRISPIEENKIHSGKFDSVCEVQCPLCGSDISDLSEELQLVHTNNCLDKGEPAKECNSNPESEPCIGENAENRCVVEWLRNLGLSKYEEIFSREEIDWETLQWLTEEDLLGMGITSLGPRKKIIHALGELRKKNDHTNDTEADVSISETTKKMKLPMNGNKLITEYFWCSSFSEKQTKASKVNKTSINSQKNSSAKRAPGRSRTGKAKVKEIPLWCCIPGTPFHVDAFRYLRGDCCHWFLTHFHLDHYQGLTRSFCHGMIYCSSITASLVHHKIGIPWDKLHVLPLNKRITVSGVNLTCFDANHCPGSVIILFEPPNGKAVLHTGDFRFSSTMANNPVLQSSQIHTLILDTTYCNPRYDFPSQETVIQFVIEAIQAEAFNPKTLFLIGSYTIGKERLFMEVGRLLQKKIYVGAAKLQILKHLELPQEIMHWLTANEAESHIHVVPMWTLASFKRMKHLSTQYADRFDLIVAFCPTGWAFGKGRKKTPGRRWQQGTIIRYEVPYSEHSSFTELREFVRFISPEHIIPSVNNDGPKSADAMLTQLLNGD